MSHTGFLLLYCVNQNILNNQVEYFTKLRLYYLNIIINKISNLINILGS